MTTNCPKSLVTPRSMAWLENFFAWKALGGGIDFAMEAKSVEALLILEQAWQMENQREQQ